MKKFFTFILFIAIFWVTNNANAQLINEFEPNPSGNDPSNQYLEIKGTPGASFTGYFLSIESDPTNIGPINNIDAVSGTFDANGLLVVSVPDHENPSSTYVLCSNSPGNVDKDLDTDDNGEIDDPTLFGTIYDAIGVPDKTSDESGLYGVNLGGQDFKYAGGGEPKLIFRDGNSDDWLSVESDGDIHDIDANSVNANTFSNGNPTNSTFGSTNPNSSEFPILLAFFNTKTTDNYVLLSWQTLTETNNDYFSIEWSKDGKNFTEIAKIAGAGTSRKKQNYSFTHTNPLNGVNYYRLTQYDFDGRSETFDVVSVTLETDKLGMLIAPNRVENNLRIEFTEPVENGRLHIYNMGGQSVQSFILARGIDIFNFDISGMVKGQYIAKYIDDKGIITKKFLKI